MVFKLEKEKEWFIEVPWGRLSVIVWGDCTDPPVLMVHGSADCAASFRPLVNLLPKNFYYVGVELPGHGRSDAYPPGLMINTYDLVYVLQLVINHFRWEQLIYVGHSFGCYLGKLYNLAYPGKMSLVVDLDPAPAYETFEPNEFAKWYHRFFTDYYNKYEEYNTPIETAPVYTRDKAIDTLKKTRGLTDEAAEIVLERMTQPAGAGLVKFVYDQRTKNITHPPFSPKHTEHLYTKIATPTLTIVTDYSVKIGRYEKTPFALDENAFPQKNYRVREVNGNHDVHLNQPERVAGFVGSFLLRGIDGVDQKAKL